MSGCWEKALFLGQPLQALPGRGGLAAPPGRPFAKCLGDGEKAPEGCLPGAWESFSFVKPFWAPEEILKTGEQLQV